MTALSGVPAAARRSLLACTHCGQDVPVSRRSVGTERQFCCDGCAAVYEIIHESGLDRYYSIKLAGGPAAAGEISSLAAPAPKIDARELSIFADEALLERLERVLPDGSHEIDVYLQGVHCPACLWLVERLPSVAPGLLAARLDLRRHVARLRYDPSKTSMEAIALTLARFGYPPHPLRDGDRFSLRRREERALLLRMGIAGAAAGNVMAISFALYGGLIFGMEASFARLLNGAAFALTLLSLLGPGRVFLTGAWRAVNTQAKLRGGGMSMDVPVAIALLLGTIWGGLNVLREGGHVYFESISVVIFLLLIARWLRFRQQRLADESIERLFRLTPQIVMRVREDGTQEAIPGERLQRGDLVAVGPGETIPADAVIDAGSTAIDQALLTGESRPVEHGPGSFVHAGTVNLAQPIVVRVERTGLATRLGALLELVSRCSNEKPPVVEMADRIAQRFVKVILLLALLTGSAWAVMSGAYSTGLERAIALLIVTCPCALGLATPLAISTALGRAARTGILIKGGAALERLATPGVLLLDKTGTVTEGALRVQELTGDTELLGIAAGLEAGVAHPIARALIRAAQERGVAAEAVGEIHHTLGRGVLGLLGGTEVRVGSPRFTIGDPDPAPAPLAEAVARAAAQGHTPVVVRRGARWLVIALGDPIRAGTKEAIDSLRERGWEIGLLSGDDERVVRAVARELDLPEALVRGEMTPEAKVDFLRELDARGQCTIMVGDGVNDAAALATAGVGVAVHGAAEASLGAADVHVTTPGLEGIVRLIDGAAATRRVIRRGLRTSLGYNLIAATLAITGLINPIIAAIMMPLSSLSVVSLAQGRSFPRPPRRTDSTRQERA